MTRKKVKLAWVENDKARALTLKRRREGLIKKVKELTILCDIRACIISFSPNEAEPVVWPSVETVHGLLDDFFALSKFEQMKKEMGIELFLNEKIKAVHERLTKSYKKNKEYVADELMMQLQHGRGIDDLNLSEIYALISSSRDKIILCRKKLDFMHFSPLRDPPVFPFEVQVEQLTITTNDAFVGGGQDDDRTGKADETTRVINIDTLRENESHYLIDRWFSAPKPLEPIIYGKIGNENPNPNGYCPYQGSCSNGNPSLEMEHVYPQLISFSGLVGSASQPLQHHNMNNNPIMDMNQPKEYPFDLMSRGLKIEEQENNNNNSQLYRSNNTVTTNDNVHQEPPPNETTVREDNVNLMSFDINRVWPDFNNHHF